MQSGSLSSCRPETHRHGKEVGIFLLLPGTFRWSFYMIRILIIEDEQPIASLIQRTLWDAGYSCEIAADGQIAYDKLKNTSEEVPYDLALLDLMLPGMDGFSLLPFFTQFDIPVIIVSARDKVEDRIQGLHMGADDYLVKPFQTGELLARVESVLRRMKKVNRKLVVGDVEVDLAQHTVKKNGQPVDLTVKEFDLLVELMQNKNAALYRQYLYERVWNETYIGETRTLDSHIQRLRKKLGWNDKIRTVFRIGYRLED